MCRLGKCDTIQLNGQLSNGTMAEITNAKKCSIPVKPVQYRKCSDQARTEWEQTAALCSVASPKKAKQINGKSLQAEKEQRISIDRRITRLKVWHLSFCSPEQLSAFGPSRAMATVVSSFGQKLNFL